MLTCSAFVAQQTGRNTSLFPRNNSTVRVQSKEQIQPAVIRRAQTPQQTANRASSSKHKVGFTISSPSEGDDDEWVSSESGAATPLQDTDSDRGLASPVEPTRPPIPRVTSHVNGFGVGNETATPRARTPPLPRVETIRPSADHSLATPRLQQPQAQRALTIDQHSQEGPGTPWGTQPQLPQVSPVPKARSETHSPPRRSPDHTMKRQAMTRPPSTHSIASRHDGAGLRPHPLIRAQSYGQTASGPVKPAPLAPLTTVLDDVVPPQMTTTSSPTSLRAVSPVHSLRTPAASPVFSHPSPSVSEAHRQLRRTSTSSARSMINPPVAPSVSQQLSRTNHERQARPALPTQTDTLDEQPDCLDVLGVRRELELERADEREDESFQPVHIQHVRTSARAGKE